MYVNSVFLESRSRRNACQTRASWRASGAGLDCTAVLAGTAAAQQPQWMSRVTERSSGDLSRSFVGGVAQNVDEGLKAKDGHIYLFVSADWADVAHDIKPFTVSRGNTIPVHVEVAENLLLCSVIIVMHGAQCGPLHLALVAHCREWLWLKTPVSVSRREVEGSGLVDYINILWCIDSKIKLYRNVTSSVGLCEHHGVSDDRWDAFWYIYKRGETTPAYSHIGLDTSATLNNQKHVAAAMHTCIERAAEIIQLKPISSTRGGEKKGGFFGRMFG